MKFFHPDLERYITRAIHEPNRYILHGNPELITKKKKYNRETKKHETIEYMCDFMTFDIETSRIIPEEYTAYMKGEIKTTETKPYSFMYVWQICLGADVISGRTWDDFILFLKKVSEYYRLNRRRRMVVYVHFLSYEMQFIQSFLKITELFAKDIRKPLYFMANEAFEFRCSYFLSNMNLRKFCENSKKCIHWKIKDEFAYDTLRTPETPLKMQEYGYIYCDVKGLHECIESRLDEDTLSTIPLTSTGYVRRDVRRAFTNSRNRSKNRRKFLDERMTLTQYELIRNIMRGGDTHASRFYSGMTVEGEIDSDDFKSSYPFVELVDYVPEGPVTDLPEIETIPYIKIEDHVFYASYLKKYCVMFKCAFRNIRLKADTASSYIDIAHVDRYSKIRGDNGRVLAADYIEYYLTEIDFHIIHQTYKFDEMKVLEGFYQRRGTFPDEFKEVVRKYFRSKTTMDGIESLSYEYVKEKNKLNATFGMLVSDIIHNEITCINGEWVEKKKTKAEKEEELDGYYNNKSNFLSYQKGIYITAHARSRLSYIREEAEKINPDAVIYWDTDSLKHLHDERIDALICRYNEGVKRINESATRPDGTTVYLGMFEREKGYKRFKTLGAKKYIVEYADGKHASTVSGLSKEKGIKWLEEEAERTKKDVFALFSIGTVITESGRTTAHYNDDTHIHWIEANGVQIKTGSNVAILDTSYQIGVTDEYYELIAENVSRET